MRNPSIAAALLMALSFGLTACGSQNVAGATPRPLEDCRGATELAHGGPTPGPGVQYVSLTVDGKLRDYRLFRPPTLEHTKPVPLVLVLHGSPIDAAGFESVIHLDSEAAMAGFLSASPNGCNGFWDYAEGRSKVADETFISQVIRQLKTEYSISKIYVVAASAGSWMAYRLACDLSGEIAAIASVAGTMRLSEACQPARSVSILEMHGTSDGLHPWDGGGPHGAYPVDAVIARWTTLDGCTGAPTATQSGITMTTTWSQCSGGAVVRLDKVVGGKHTWFGSDFDPVPGEPNANAVIWNFFSSLQPSG
jgi:polyhydroxybutyrate depolymerase